MKLITLFVPESYILKTDDLVKNGFYPNRAEAFRAAIRDMLLSHDVFKTIKKPEPAALPAIEYWDELHRKPTVSPGETKA